MDMNKFKGIYTQLISIDVLTLCPIVPLPQVIKKKFKIQDGQFHVRQLAIQNPYYAQDNIKKQLGIIIIMNNSYTLSGYFRKIEYIKYSVFYLG